MSAGTTTSQYVKTWMILLVLLVISVCGPLLEIQVVTLISAFGIAVVKATMVASKFMHINIEKKFISYILLSMLLFCLLFYMGTAPDVMQPSGQNWERISN